MSAVTIGPSTSGALTAGTFDYVGDNTGSTYNITNNLTTTTPADYLYYNLTIDDTHGTPDKFTTGTDPLKVYGDLSVQGGTLDLTSSPTVNVAGSVSISSGATLKAPALATTTAFTVGGSWTNSGGTFTNNNGEVNFNTATTAPILPVTPHLIIISIRTLPGKRSILHGLAVPKRSAIFLMFRRTPSELWSHPAFHYYRD